jgi:MFS family permease
MFTRNFLLILMANILLGSAMPLLIILGGFAGAELVPGSLLVTLPPTVQTLAGILVAAPLSIFMGRFGRQAGFLLSAGLVMAGGALGAVAMQISHFGLLCLGHLLLGAALIGVNYFRFAAAESVAEKKRARAMSFTLASGLVAALLGPEIFTLTRNLLPTFPFAGAYWAIAGLGLIGLLPVLGLGKELRQRTQSTGQAQKGAWKALIRRPQILFAIGVAALSHAVMVFLMTPTPLAMTGCGFGEGQAADVIRWHVVAMFAPGFFTGHLIERFGAKSIASLGLLISLGSAAVAASGLDLSDFYIALILLGLGWNFGFTGGSHLLQASVTAEEKPLVQGVNDTLIALCSSLAALSSGAMVVSVGWTALSIAVMPVIVVLMAALMLIGRQASNSEKPLET